MKIIKKLLKTTIILTIISIFLLIGLYIYAYLSDGISINKTSSYYLYDINDNLVYQGSEKGTWVTLDNIDEKIKKYVIATEDQYFYKHFGFDYLRIVKSLFNNIVSKRIVEGASSISQQYVKNLYLDFDKTLDRKLEEAYLTIQLETHYTKDEILEGYLNTIYYGNGIYGINDACKFYFNKKPDDVTIEEAIMLAGIPKSPNKYNPVDNKNEARKRFNTIYNLLYKKNIVNNQVDFNNLNVYGSLDKTNLNTIKYYQDAVLNELKNINISDNLKYSNGIRIFTNLNLDVQAEMEKSINEHMEDDNTQVASIVVEPSTGKVLALTGGRNYMKSEYNRALNSKRQVGSTIKPFLYYSALEAGMTESSTFKSEETTFVFAENKKYSPTNYSDTYANKDISMAAALAYSDNVYAVKTHLFLGEQTLVDTLKTSGLQTKLKSNPSLALGSNEINMLDYITAYSTLASGGYKKDSYFINKIEDIDGNLLYEHKGDNILVLDPSITYIVNEMMRNTYNYDFIDYMSPTILYLNGKLDRKYALKSGTTDNDYWITGYNNDVLMMVWAGEDNNKDVDQKYSRIIKDIWLDTVTSYEKDKNDTWYPLPTNVVAIPCDPITGKYDTKSKSLFYFIKGTENAYIK